MDVQDERLMDTFPVRSQMQQRTRDVKNSLGNRRKKKRLMMLSPFTPRMGQLQSSSPRYTRQLTPTLIFQRLDAADIHRNS